MNPQISSKARKKDNVAKPKLTKRQCDRRFIEQLDDLMDAINGMCKGNLTTKYNRTIASKRYGKENGTPLYDSRSA